MVTWDDFDRIWARTSPLTPYEFSEPNYSQGWNFVGSTPPARQMWDSIQKKNDEKFKYLRDNFGTPNIVTQASQMTDTDKVYVYIGSEAGWNSGHWYYYNEGTSSWEDGGVYNSVAFVTDTTLSIAGQPADAKAVGDALALKADLAGCTFTGNVSVNADFSVTGDSTLTGNVSASGDIVVVGDVSSANMITSADATIGGALSVAGASTLTGNVSAGADITVVGDVSSANIIASNNANIGGNATVTGSVASASLTTTADGTIGGNLSVSGTTALAGTSTAPTPSADDNSTKIATTEYVQTEIKPIETDVDIAQKDIANIKALLQGNLYDYQTDSTSAYIKSVPAGAMPYAGLEKVGGKTIVMNQLCNNGNFAGTTGWSIGIGSASLTATDNVLTVTVSSASSVVRLGGAITSAPFDHKFYIKGEFKFNNTLPNNVISMGVAGYYSITGSVTELNQWTKVSGVFTRGNIGANTMLIDVPTANLVADDTFEMRNVVLIDITQMFGSGNEPSTAAEVEAMLPADFYAKNAGTLLSAGVTSVVSKDTNNSTLQTYSIPAEVQALEGYGWSCPDHYNYIDYEAKKFVQEVGSRAYASGDESDSTVITDGTNTYYALSPAVETDISQYITDDNLIEVEANGTLTFPNSNGADYCIPVPSEETYMIDLQEAINNG